MSRVDNSDDQRIREMQEAELRDRADREKRANNEKVTTSFQEVMQNRSAREQGQRIQRQQAMQEHAGKENAQKHAAQDKKQPANTQQPMHQNPLARNAQLSQQAQNAMAKLRTNMSDQVRTAETERYNEIVAKSDDERERIGKDVEKERLTDARKSDETQGSPLQGILRGDDDDRVHRDRERRGNQGGQKEEGKAEGVSAAEGPRGAAPVKIPQELIDRIAEAIRVGLGADGRTEMHVSLKGTMLDGVTLKVTSKKGKVHCVFEGCDKQLGNLIESSKGELMRQLSKRGLELEILRVR